jgi:hypothetical protein
MTKNLPNDVFLRVKRTYGFSACSIMFYTDSHLLQQTVIYFGEKCIESVARCICY